MIRPYGSWFRPSGEIAWTPPVDLYRARKGWLIKMDLAGVRDHEIEVRVQGARLIVSGSRRDQTAREGWQLYQMEISYNRFERVLEFPERLEGMTMRSTHREGMLLIEIFREDGREKA